MSEGEALRRESWRRAQSVFTRGVPRAGAAAMLAIALATPCTARAQRNAPAERAATRRVVTAYAARTRGAIQLDGKLDEPAWSAAPAESTFTQSYPKPGAPPSERTVFRVLYDGHNLYVGVRAYDTHPDSIAAQLARRDSYGIYSDWIHVVVDSYHDRRTAFRFSVNPLGVEKDALEYNDTNEDLNWDAVWEVATRRDSLGWTAEYRIPLSQLRFGGAPPGGVRTWGFQVQRDIARYNERDSWAPWTQTSPGYVSSFGDLTGLRDIPVPARLELLPYVSARLTRAPGDGADPFYRANAFRPSVGGDLTYGLPGGLTLNATVNPDFGQVEVDPAVVNLSAFETFFPEKRPFFLEGSNIFQFGQVYTNDSYGNEYFFYSRRIGRQPERSVGGPGVLYVNAPDQTAILGATKVTGRAGPWTVGVLDAVTNRETAQYLTTSGVRGTTPVEPLTNYGVARVQRDFGQGTTVLGAMLTATDRSARDTVFSSLLRSRALVGGVDFQHTWAAREWIVSGYAAGSNVSGSRAVIAATQRTSTHYYQRPDAPYLHYDSTRTQLGGYITEVAVAKRGPWFGSLDLKTVSPGLELNDLGFQGRADYRFASLDVGHQWSDPGRVFRNAVVFSAVGNVWNYGGNLIGQYDILGGQGRSIPCGQRA